VQLFVVFGTTFIIGNHNFKLKMDRTIEISWFKKNQKWLITLGLVLMLLVAFLVLAFSGGDFELRRDKLRVGEVTYGDFQEIVMANGFIEPKRTVLIDAKEGGTVQDILVEDGQMVKAGDVLVVLTNEALMLDYMQRETQIVEQINNLRNTRINLDQNFRVTEDQLAEYSKELILAQKQYEIDSSLFAVNGIAQKAYEDSKTTFLFLKNKVKTLRSRKQQDKAYQYDQVGRIDHSINLMERNLEVIREKLNEMSIKAPISGQLSAFNLEPGEVLQRNSIVGRIDVPNNFWIRALVDQHYVNRIHVGQGGFITYSNQDFRVEVSKVQSIVENGQMEIYLDFNDSLPSDMMRGQNQQVFIEVSAKKEAHKIPKGSFFQSSGGKFVFVLSQDGSKAFKREVVLGRQNPQFYEVLEGLEEGEQVIISSYENYRELTEITIGDKPE